jgi:hypothetical protein
LKEIIIRKSGKGNNSEKENPGNYIFVTTDIHAGIYCCG